MFFSGERTSWRSSISQRLFSSSFLSLCRAVKSFSSSPAKKERRTAVSGRSWRGLSKIWRSDHKTRTSEDCRKSSSLSEMAGIPASFSALRKAGAFPFVARRRMTISLQVMSRKVPSLSITFLWSSKKERIRRAIRRPSSVGVSMSLAAVSCDGAELPCPSFLLLSIHSSVTDPPI